MLSPSSLFHYAQLQMSFLFFIVYCSIISIFVLWSIMSWPINRKSNKNYGQLLHIPNNSKRILSNKILIKFFVCLNEISCYLKFHICNGEISNTAILLLYKVRMEFQSTFVKKNDLFEHLLICWTSCNIKSLLIFMHKIEFD